MLVSGNYNPVMCHALICPNINPASSAAWIGLHCCFNLCLQIGLQTELTKVEECMWHHNMRLAPHLYNLCLKIVCLANNHREVYEPNKALAAGYHDIWQ